MAVGFGAAQRMRDVPFSGIRRVAERAAEIERGGKPVIHMEIGRPDFDTPEHIKAAAVGALREGFVHYTSNYGLLSLREAIAAKLARDNGLVVNPDGEVIVTVGAAEAIAITILGFVERGDEVLIPDPAWLNYRHCTAMAEGRAVAYPLRAELGFEPDPDELASLITRRTKLLVINSPHNPTGGVASEETLKRLAELAMRHDLLVLSDEMYEKIIYDDVPHLSIGALPGMADRTVTVNGFSKAYAMDGWRLGYLAADRRLVETMVRVRQYLTTTPTSFAQVGAAAAYSGPQGCVAAMRQEFQRRRDFLVPALNELAGLTCIQPRGAFYAFPSVAGLGLSAEEAATLLLEEAHVAVVPGTAFGKGGAGHVRLSYATDYESIEEAMKRITAVLGRRGR